MVPQQQLFQVKITPLNKQRLIALSLKIVKVLSGEKLQARKISKGEQ